MGERIETYRGEALAWEADELGHMNMRYYFAKVAEARANFCLQLNLKNMYRADGFSTLVPTRQHVKYHKEVRPGHGLVITTGIVELGENTMTLVHVITSPSPTHDIVSATIVETVVHMARRTQKAFGWPGRMRNAAQAYIVDMPESAVPRNIDLSEEIDTPTMAKADALGLQIIGRGMFATAECDVFGTVTPTEIIGRVSNSVKHLRSAWPDLGFTDGGDSGALLEACAYHRHRPQAGDCFVVRSGLRSANAYTREICHWILDPLTGKCWSSFVGVGCRFDLKARKLVKVEGETLATIRAGIVSGLKP